MRIDFMIFRGVTHELTSVWRSNMGMLRVLMYMLATARIQVQRLEAQYFGSFIIYSNLFGFFYSKSEFRYNLIFRGVNHWIFLAFMISDWHIGLTPNVDSHTPYIIIACELRRIYSWRLRLASPAISLILGMVQGFYFWI